MREKWSHIIALLTGMLVLLLTFAFAFIQNPADLTDNAESKKQTPIPITTPLDSKCIEDGRKVYQQQTCARCHSIAGEGNPRNPLDGVGARRNTEELRNWIVGADTLKEELSPRAFKLKQSYSKLPDDNLKSLVAYMQSLRPEENQTVKSKPAIEPVVVASGEDGQCLTCHSNAGHLMQVVKPAAAFQPDSAFLTRWQSTFDTIRDMTPKWGKQGVDAFKATVDAGVPLVFLDIRTSKEWKSGIIENAILINLNDLPKPESLTKLPRDRNMIIAIYCKAGHRSTLALTMLHQLGYKNAISMSGGMQAWRKAGYPVADVSK